MTAHPAVYFLVPGDLATPTGGFAFARRMIAALSDAGRLAGVIRLPDRFPEIDAQTRALAADTLAAVPAGAVLIVDGLAFAPLAAELAARPDLRLIALVHHPLCDETGLGAAARDRWFEAERRALRLAARVIATSGTTAARLAADFDVPQDRITVVRPGVAGTVAARPRAAAAMFGDGRQTRLLAVGSLVPRKGHDVLLAALSRLRSLDWRLELVGAPRDPAYARRLRQMLRQCHLAGRVRLAGAVSDRELLALYRAASLFVLPSRHEGYGMAIAEAVAAGVPVVTTRAGGIGEAVAGGVAVFVPPDRPATLAATLRPLLTRPELRRGLRRRAWALARASRTWAAAEAEFIAAVADGVAR